MTDMRLDKFTQRAQEAVHEAQSQAEAFNHAQIEPEHLLLALLQQDDGVAPQIVLGLGTLRRDREGSCRGVQHPAASAGRWPLDRWPWPYRLSLIHISEPTRPY